MCEKVSRATYSSVKKEKEGSIYKEKMDYNEFKKHK